MGIPLVILTPNFGYYSKFENLLNVILKEDIFKTHTLFLANNNQYKISLAKEDMIEV